MYKQIDKFQLFWFLLKSVVSKFITKEINQAEHKHVFVAKVKTPKWFTSIFWKINNNIM
jgi:hypothetical protein